jgi:hypothetical protein
MVTALIKRTAIVQASCIKIYFSITHLLTSPLEMNSGKATGADKLTIGKGCFFSHLQVGESKQRAAALLGNKRRTVSPTAIVSM